MDDEQLLAATYAARSNEYWRGREHAVHVHNAAELQPAVGLRQVMNSTYSASLCMLGGELQVATPAAHGWVDSRQRRCTNTAGTQR